MTNTPIPINPPSEQQKEPITLSHTIQMQADAVSSVIESNYQHGQPYQWAVELWRNFQQLLWILGGPQPHHTQKFDILDVGASTSISKRVVWNTAAPLSVADLDTYFSSLGAGAGDLFRLDNPNGKYHQGARVSLLPWNPAGLAVLTVQPGGTSHMIVLGLDSKNLYAVLTGTVVPTGVFGPVDLRKAITPDLKKHGGVAFVMLGKDASITDADGVDPAKGETAGGLYDELQNRVRDPHNVKVVVAEPGNAKGGGATIGGDPKGRQASVRTLHLHPWPATAQGSVVVDEYGTRIDWFVRDAEDPKSARHRPFRSEGHGVVVYGDENVSIGREWFRVAPQFGIPIKGAYKRVALHIVPPTNGPKWHVVQTSSRSGLAASDGSPLPMDKWAEAFEDTLPEEIQKVIDQERAKISKDLHGARPQRVERLLARIKSRIAAITEVRTSGKGQADPAEDDIDGKGAGDGPTKSKTKFKRCGNRGTGKRAGKVTPIRNAKGGVAAATKTTTMGAPQVEWLTADEWDANHAQDAPDKIAWYVDETLIHANLSHPILQEQFKFWALQMAEAKTKASRRLPADAISLQVQEAYTGLIATMALAQVAQHGKHKAREILNGEHVWEVALSGFENAELRIANNLANAAKAGGTPATSSLTPTPEDGLAEAS